MDPVVSELSVASGSAASGSVASAAQARAVPFYRPELDGLRFFAFLAVYMVHTVGFGNEHRHNHLPIWLGDLLGTIGLAGVFGVDLFFVLSSYLITELLLRERAARGELDVKAFYIRRMLRIWPLYFLFVFAAYALTFAVPSEGLTWKHVLGYMLFAGNWVYFLMPVTTIAAPLWSISLEEQFYLIWPWVIRRSGPRRLVICALGIMALAMGSRLAMGILHPNFDWVTKNSFTRIDGIAVGALLAVALRGRLPRLSAAARGALLFGCIGVLLWIAYSFGLLHVPVGLIQLMLGWPLAALACGGILVAVLGSSDSFTAPLRSAPLVYLGRISYGLYVYHELVLKFDDVLFPDYAVSASQMLAHWFFGLAGTVALAAASYRWIELPFLRLKRERFTVGASRPDGDLRRETDSGARPEPVSLS
jgi:peptidoglycan/LPS O-acetylase OafA/YrhL